MSTIDTIKNAAMPNPLWRIVKLPFHALAWLDRALERRRSRLALRELDDHFLKDIGISRADAEREARRPFWD